MLSRTEVEARFVDVFVYFGNGVRSADIAALGIKCSCPHDTCHHQPELLSFDFCSTHHPVLYTNLSDILAMLSQFQSSYQRVEAVIQRLTDSIAAYNPSTTAAEELVAADDAVNGDIEQCTNRSN